MIRGGCSKFIFDVLDVDRKDLTQLFGAKSRNLDVNFVFKNKNRSSRDRMISIPGINAFVRRTIKRPDKERIKESHIFTWSFVNAHCKVLPDISQKKWIDNAAFCCRGEGSVL